MEISRLLDYDDLSTTVLDPRPSVIVSDTALVTSWSEMAWSDFVPEGVELLSYATPSEHISSGLKPGDIETLATGVTIPTDANGGTNDQISPLSIFLMRQGGSQLP